MRPPAMLLSHDWPGNVRELRNVIERAMVLEEADWIQTSSLQIASDSGKPPLLPFEESQQLLESHATAAAGPDDPFGVSLEEAEKNLVKKALEKAGGNQTRAAVLLGVTRDTLRYKMKKFNLR